MTIFANCSDCSSNHQLADRILTEENLISQCPKCDSLSYETYYDDVVIEEEEEKITEAIEDIPGVGEGVIQNILQNYSTMSQLKAARINELAKVEGIGKTVAKRIVENL